MRKKILWISIGFSIVGVINLIVFAILSSLGIAYTRNLSYVFAIGFIASVWVPMVINLIFKTKFSITLLVLYNIFMFLSICAGSLWNGYNTIFGFDKFLHFSSGVLFAVLIYDIFANGKENRIGLFWIFLLTFSFAMMCGGVWEIYEFTTDILFENNAQGTVGMIGREAIVDTMGDLIADFIGAIIGGVLAVIFEWRKRKKSSVESTETK